MSALSVHPVAGATATATGAEDHHGRHLIGNAMRALRVMAGAAFEVVILGRVEEERAGRRVS
ncbi:hypothetical protein [Streptomyces sp. 6N223]|uniref:hypothetical protein n=1 Tax=Streptomyces sp. 6N223 TaxID=3457412 RepID=UPI003FCF7D4D